MPMSIPPWLMSVNPVPYFMEGVSQGSSIAERQNSAERAIQEMTMRREAQQRQQEAQELATSHTLQQMAIAKQASDQKAAEAAMKWQGQQEYQSLINAGKTPEEAFTATAHKLMPGGTGLAHLFSVQAQQREINERTKERMQATAEWRKQQEDLQRERLDLYKANLERLKNAPKPARKTLQQAAAEKVITQNIAAKQREIAEARKNVFPVAGGDMKGNAMLSKLEGELAAYQKQLKDLYEPAPAETGTAPETQDEEQYPLPDNTLTPTPTTPGTNSVLGATSPSGFTPPKSKGKITVEMARHFKALAKGNRALAEKMAVDDGWEL